MPHVTGKEPETREVETLAQGHTGGRAGFTPRPGLISEGKEVHPGFRYDDTREMSPRGHPEK